VTAAGLQPFSLWRQGLMAVTSSGLTLAVSLVSGILIARQLGTEGRGELTAILILTAMLGWAFAAGVSQAAEYYQAREPEHGGRLITTWLLLILVLGAVAAAAGELLAPVLMAAQSGSTIQLARLYVLTAFTVPLTELFVGVLLGDHDFGFFNIFRVAQPVAMTVLFVLLWALHSFTLTTALAATLVSGLAGIVVLAVRAIGRHGLGRPSPRLALTSFWYGLRAHGNTLAGMANLRLDLLIIPAILAASTVGLYAVATSVAWLIVALSSNLSSVVLAAAARQGPDGTRTVLTSLQATLVVALAIAVGLALLADLLVPFVYGRAFADSVLPLRLLLPGAVLYAGANIVLSGLYAANRPLTAALTQVGGLVITVVGLLVFLRLGGIVAAALVSTASYAVVFVLAVVFYKRAAGLAWSEFIPTWTELTGASARALLGARERLGLGAGEVAVGEMTGGHRPRVMLVVHDIDSQRHGGLERIFTELVRRGSDRVDFTVVSNTLSPDLRQNVRWRRVPAIRRPYALKFLIFFMLAPFRIGGRKQDLVHSVGAIIPSRIDVSSVQYCYAAYVQRIGSAAPRGGSRLRRLNVALGNLVSLAAELWSFRPSRVRLLAAASDSTRRELELHYPAVPAITTPNGVDFRTFKPDTKARRRLRAAEGVGDEELVCLFVGGDWARKGVEQAVRGLARAQDLTDRPLRLWLVGGGDQRRLEAVAAECGVAGRVSFFGFRPDVEPFYQAADLFVFPTLYEAFPLVALEAAACALPIVATPVSGVTELVGDNEAGMLVERSPESIGAAIARLAADDKTRARMAAAALRRVAAYSWEGSVASVIDAYQSLIGGSQPDSVTRPAELEEARR
jgi:glycosyltransferase involved in cell wall biosynthesis/O-antigen/teichoic acid export membrane protein